MSNRPPVKFERVQERFRFPPQIGGFWTVLVLVAIIIFLCFNSAYVIEPTELAGVRRLGQVVSQQPVEPGLHFKVPLLDQVDRLQVSLETYRIDQLTVNTIDNQPIKVSVGLTYRIPKSAVLFLLYSVGRAGNVDLDANFERIIADRTAKIFAQQNTTRISESRNEISTALKQLLSTDLRNLFQIDVIDFQISDIIYSESFRASVEAAVKAKNEAVAAENTVNRVKYEAQQNVEKANGDAQARLRIADAERQAAILQAQGKAEAIRLEGESRANVLRLNAQVLKESPLLIDLTKADRWNGILPSVLLEGSSATPLLALPSLTPTPAPSPSATPGS
jgi:regulator of protease activity HflC (stomatin/prohibitin superfamily)